MPSVSAVMSGDRRASRFIVMSGLSSVGLNEVKHLYDMDSSLTLRMTGNSSYSRDVSYDRNVITFSYICVFICTCYETDDNYAAVCGMYKCLYGYSLF